MKSLQPHHRERHGFFTLSLLLLLVSRSLLDATVLSGVVAILLLCIFFLRILTLRSVHLKEITLFVIIIYFLFHGYIAAVFYHEYYIYPLRGAVRYFSYGAVFLLAFHSDIKIHAIYRAYTIVVVIQVLSCMVQIYAGQMGQPPGTLLHRNNVSSILIPYFTFTLIYYGHYMRALAIFLFSMFIGGLGGFISLTAIGLVFLFRRATVSHRLCGILLIPILFVTASFFLSERIEEQRHGSVQLPEVLEGTRQVSGKGSLVWRIYTYRNITRELVREGNIWFGMGLESTSGASPYVLESSRKEPHNDYLRVLVEFGVMGFSFYLLLYFIAWQYFHKRGRTDSFSSAFAYTLFGLAIGQLGMNIIAQSALWWFFFAFAGGYFGLLYRSNLMDCSLSLKDKV